MTDLEKKEKEEEEKDMDIVITIGGFRLMTRGPVYSGFVSALLGLFLGACIIGALKVVLMLLRQF